MSTRFLLSDALSSIHNKRALDKSAVVLQYSNLVLNLLKIMKDAGYIKRFEVTNEKLSKINVFPSIDDGKKILNSFVVHSKPSIRVYKSTNDIKHLLLRNKFKLYVFSTNKGVMSAEDAIKNNIGGEFLCELF